MSKISFGFAAVQAGQKSNTVNAEPRLVANSTAGKFQVTSPVSKALNVAVGENIMFLNNIASIENAIAQNNADVKAWAEENGIDLTTREGHDAAVAELSVWAIAKGVPTYDSKGNPIMSTVRLTVEEKKAYIADNAESLIADADFRDVLVGRVGNPDATDEELIAAIDVDDVEFPSFHACTGSKTATTGSATGVGCQLNFSDTSIWNTLKSDLKEDKTKKNRNYNVLLDQPFDAEVNNGMENVTVVAYPIEFVEDTDPIIREKKN